MTAQRRYPRPSYRLFEYLRGVDSGLDLLAWLDSRRFPDLARNDHLITQVDAVIAASRRRRPKGSERPLFQFLEQALGNVLSIPTAISWRWPSSGCGRHYLESTSRQYSARLMAEAG